MATKNRLYPEAPATARPDVPYYLNGALAAIDADVQKLDTRLGETAAGIPAAVAAGWEGRRPYTLEQTAGRVVKVWDYLNNREQIIYGDTGARDITALLSVPTSGGFVYVHRHAQMVTLSVEALKLLTSSLGVITVLPSGFRPARTAYFQLEEVSLRGQVTIYGNVQLYNWRQELPIYGTVTFPTSDPWPATLPGKPAV